jgi:hypothetical protein
VFIEMDQTRAGEREYVIAACMVVVAVYQWLVRRVASWKGGGRRSLVFFLTSTAAMPMTRRMYIFRTHSACIFFLLSCNGPFSFLPTTSFAGFHPTCTVTLFK